MRPTRRAAAVAAAAVSRPLSPSPISSEEDEMDSSELEEMEMDTGDNEIFSEEDEIEEEEEEDNHPVIHDIIDNNNGMESLSEQEEDEDEEEREIIQEDEEDEDEEDEEEEEEEEEEQVFNSRKTVARNKNTTNGNNKRKKPVEQDSEEEEFSEDTEILQNRPMTKRQRAKVYQEIPEEFLELPMDSGKKKLLTEEEEQLKKSEVARRRKNQSIQRAEKDKADTINRLLKKQASKSKRIIDDTDDKGTAHEKLMRSEDPNRLRYINTSKGSQLCIPTVFTIEQIFGDTINKSPSPPKVKKCEVNGCIKNRKYTAKKSGKSVCSLDHYKLVEAV